MELTHWKKLNNPDYLGAYAFQPGEEIIATIGSVGRETITNADGKKEECTVAHFTAPAGIKPMILNPTNCKTIEKVAGTPYIEQWQGVMIQLYVTQVKAFGDVVDAVRVRPNKPRIKLQQPVETCADCGKTIEAAYGKDAASVASLTRSKYGRPLCAACATAARKAITEQEGLVNENHEN